MLNRVMLIGRLGFDPEVRYLPSGDAITNIRMATSRRWKDKNGERKEDTEWHRVVFFGGLGKIAGEYLKKGSLVYVAGRIRTNQWEKDGVKHYTTEIIAEEMQMLDSKSGGTTSYGDAGAPPVSSYENQGGPAPGGGAAGGFDDFDDDIPF